VAKTECSQRIVISGNTVGTREGMLPGPHWSLSTLRSRPHITVKFQQQSYCALVDSSSEVFFINTNVGRHAESLGYNANKKSTTVHLANNSLTEIPGAVILPIIVEKGKFSHFRVFSNALIKGSDANWDRFMGKNWNQYEVTSTENSAPFPIYLSRHFRWDCLSRHLMRNN